MKRTIYVPITDGGMSRVTIEIAAAGVVVAIASDKVTTAEDQRIVREQVTQYLAEHMPELHIGARVDLSSNPDIRRQEMALMLVSTN